MIITNNNHLVGGLLINAKQSIGKFRSPPQVLYFAPRAGRLRGTGEIRGTQGATRSALRAGHARQAGAPGLRQRTWMKVPVLDWNLQVDTAVYSCCLSVAVCIWWWVKQFTNQARW